MAPDSTTNYAPGLIAQCVHSRLQAEILVAGWLERYNLAGRSDAHDKAVAAATWFADFKAFRSHARPVTREQVEALGLNVHDLDADKELQDLVLSVHHAMRLTLAGTGAFKVIENPRTCYVESVGMVMMVSPQGGQPGNPPQAQPPQLGASRPNRQQRRHPNR